MSLELVNAIFGMKVRQARLEAGMTLSDLARESEMSPSYLTEIEKGRKYPRTDKIVRMAEALNKEYDDLVSIKLAPSLRYLEKALSSTTLQRFPFEEFGLEPADALALMTREPERASALLHAVLEIARRYDLQEEDFIRAALRSYQEIHENYFPELEEAALAFTAEFGAAYAISDTQTAPLSSLMAILRHEYGYVIDDRMLSATPELSGYRSVLIPGDHPQLYINDTLYDRQLRFILARELGYCYLGLKERSLSSTPDRIDSFQQLLNDQRAAYFGGALLMPQVPFLADVEALFSRTTWDPDEFSAMLQTYDVTPEMLLYRFSELVPQAFGVKLHLLRFHHTDGTGDYQLIRQLNMNQLLVPSGIGLDEHYCRRWLSVRLLPDPDGQDQSQSNPLPVDIQISEFLDSHDRFLCMGFGRRMVLSPDVASSVIVGFRIDDNLRQAIRFLDDPAIPQLMINETCERCPLTAEQCLVRGAPPTILLKQQAQITRQQALEDLGQRPLSEAV